MNQEEQLLSSHPLLIEIFALQLAADESQHPIQVLFLIRVRFPIANYDILEARCTGGDDGGGRTSHYSIIDLRNELHFY